jgi:hypothetical protein
MALSDVHWKGMKALEVMANVLPDKIGGQKLRDAYRYALEPTRTQMRENIPRKRTGNLWLATDITIKSGFSGIDTMFGVVGPRRKKHTYAQQGWHSHIIEMGSKPHTITAGPGKLMPIFTSAGFTGRFAKSIQHPGSKAFKTFQRAIDSTWRNVADRVSDKVAVIMRSEIKAIWREFGHVATRPTGRGPQGRDPTKIFQLFGR